MRNRKLLANFPTAVALVAAVLFLAHTGRATAYVERMYALKEVLDESTNICLGKIEKVDVENKQIIAKMERDLKGKNPYETIRMNIRTSLPQFIPYMMAKVKPGQQILVFYKKEGQAIACLCYMDRFWFQLYGQDLPDRSKMWWRMTHVEIRMNRTWNKSLTELVNVITKVLAGKMKPPAPDPNVPPFDVKKELAKIPGALKGLNVPAVGKIFGRYVALPHGPGEARGVSWVDYDGDGDLDAYCCCKSGNALYQSEGGGIFIDVTKDVGLSGATDAAAWADYNADGLVDLLLPTPKLFTNLGDKFRDDTALLPKITGAKPVACGWIDYDGDGWPDIIMPAGPNGIALLRNPGKKGQPFKDVSTEAGLGPKGPGRAAGNFISIADYDGDGFSDFLYNAGSGMLFHNTGEGKFELVKSSGIKFDPSATDKVGPAWGDFDNDGDLDLFVPQSGVGKLFRNNNDGTFSDVTNSAGDLAKVKGRWTAAAWGDVDRDGWLDLYVGKADGDARLFINKGDGTFANMVEPLGLYHVLGNARVLGVAMGDFDGDGDLDLLANSLDQRTTVFINDYSHEDPKRTFLAVRPSRSRGLIGAVIRVFDEHDRLLGLRELGVAQSAGGQAPTTAFFGLAKGKYKITACMSDGAFGQKIVEVGAEGLSTEVGAKE